MEVVGPAGDMWTCWWGAERAVASVVKMWGLAAGDSVLAGLAGIGRPGDGRRGRR
jgi:hypothetical protein